MKLQKLIMTALLMALIMITTMAVQIPILGGGYIHPGDGFVLMSGLILGPVWGFVSAGVGSALADIALGFTPYAPATLLIKGLMAFLVGHWKKAHFKWISLAFVLAEIIMVLGYFIYEWFIITGNIKTAMAGIPWNVTQATGGVVIAIFLYIALAKTKIIPE